MRHAAYFARRKYLILAIFFMAISFFAFMKLVTVADLSFAVPATAGQFCAGDDSREIRSEGAHRRTKVGGRLHLSRAV